MQFYNKNYWVLFQCNEHERGRVVRRIRRLISNNKKGELKYQRRGPYIVREMTAEIRKKDTKAWSKQIQETLSSRFHFN